MTPGRWDHLRAGSPGWDNKATEQAIESKLVSSARVSLSGMNYDPRYESQINPLLSRMLMVIVFHHNN